ncbi:Capsule polysaccharide export protein [Acidisarcina polymorpha]|uniref:Capsule polysaccharide export protein n=1 Tax=Acidisarcina polymorpha TaxID=2211140 RepID=A0A2Z5G3Q9_9BACT|nr:polysaccharide biosynthesis/export family protein [Acidisarcina polymorpha]AXC13434.1 Capsule polysaccharide export protein [Acidisarcina polymorpha]
MLLASAQGQETSTPPNVPDAQPSNPQPAAINIGPGDLLDVVVFDTPELSSHVRVAQDGSANMPVIGRVDLNGLNADQAARYLEQQFRKQHLLLEPHVTVFIVEYASQGATISGEIRQPGIYPTLGKRRLLDMLAIAGGISPTAGKTVSIIHRDDPTHPVLVPLQGTAANLNAQENPQILPGDTIVVGKAGVVYIVGDVGKPGGFLVDNNERLSTAQALALAGGPNRTASLSKTRLIRKVAGGREEYMLDLAKLLKGEQADLKLNDGDIIWVPSSQFKTFGYRGIEAAIAITSGLIIYRN